MTRGGIRESAIVATEMGKGVPKNQDGTEGRDTRACCNFAPAPLRHDMWLFGVPCFLYKKLRTATKKNISGILCLKTFVMVFK